MERSELFVYGITVKGVHPDLFCKRYYGVALNLDDALNLVSEKAESDGWSEIDIDSVEKLGDLSFAPWNSKYYEENESEVEKCQQSNCPSQTEE